ncbi:hypothetical protein ACIOHS_15315 [Streptomyces sp. NPDC088253]|uniref:hypothetical protein n=1 Tax=Streptomyces sp. NPDC088253 TaxID=3365846 RepID=UPI00382BD5CA
MRGCPYKTRTPMKVPTGEGGHGGGDVRMPADPLGRAVDGARSLVTGLAANRSFESGPPVRARALLDV